MDTINNENNYYGNYHKTLVTAPFKNELVLEENNFHLLEQRTNKVALAQVIQNIILFRQGNYPNQPELGVGIEDYLFEPSTNDTLSKLKNKIDEQIKKFVPTDYTVNFTVENIKNDDRLNILSISFTIEDYDNMEQTDFAILYGRNQTTNKIISKLVV